MNLIEKIRELAELDKKIMPGDLNVDYEELKDMLEVLGVFQKGDADALAGILDNYFLECDDHVVIDRLLVAARTMEGEP